MSFHSLPLVINEIRATEAVLNRIYDAAKLGLKGDNLALASGMTPTHTITTLIWMWTCSAGGSTASPTVHKC